MEKDEHITVSPEPHAAEGAERQDQGAEPVAGEGGGGVAGPAAELSADLAAAYQKLLTEKDALHDRLLRKAAELENFRKRTQRDKEDFFQHATADLIRALLPTLDGFERALKHRDANVPEKFYEGMELIYRQLLEALRRAGLTPIETQGKIFDPLFHQAVETVEAVGYREQEIVEELQRGYKLKHRLLRPAIVKVAMKPKSGNSIPAAQ